MKELLKKLGNNKIKIASGAVSIASFALSIVSGVIENKQLEETVNQTVKAEIASIINEVNEENKEEDAQNE